MMEKSIWAWFLFSISILTIIILVPLKLSRYLTMEDGIIENASAICYIISSILFFYLFFYKKKSLFYLLGAISTFIFFAEEISWGQRIFGFNIEFIQNNNLQNEVNLHNLEIFKSPKFNETRSLKDIFLSSQNLFRIAFFIYFLILPFVLKLTSNFTQTFLLQSNFYVGVFIIFTLSFLLTIITNQELNIPIAETREYLYSFTIFFYSFCLFKKIK